MRLLAILLMPGLLVAILLVAGLFGAPLYAQETASLNCADPKFSELLQCSQKKLATLKHKGDSFLSCGGTCIVTTGARESTISPIRGGIALLLDGMQFLHGYKRPACLRTALAFVRKDGALFLVALKGANAQGPKRLDLPAAISAPDSGFLSCDGKTLLYRTDADQSLVVARTASGKRVVTDAWMRKFSILDMSADGRYLLGVERDTGLIVVRNIASGKQIKTQALFELDQVFFDVAIKHVIAVRRSQDPVFSQIYALPKGVLVKTLQAGLPGGLPVTIDRHKNDRVITILKPN